MQSKVIVINVSLLYEALNADCCQPSSKIVNSPGSVILQTIEVKISNLNFEEFGRPFGLLRWEARLLFSELHVYRRMHFSLTPQPLEKKEVISFATSETLTLLLSITRKTWILNINFVKNSNLENICSLSMS